MNKKCLAIGIILLFVGTCIIPAIAQDTEKPLSTSRGNWLYVGGSGPGNYTKIQDAINDSSDGDTVFVYDDLSPYTEMIILNKSIRLLGEDMNTTIIGQTVPHDNYVTLSSDSVIISDFTFSESRYYGVWIEDASNVIIERCVFYSNAWGVIVHMKAENISIRNCSYRSNHVTGLQISGWGIKNTEVSYCDFFENGEGLDFFRGTGAIHLWSVHGIKIHHCNITNNWQGVVLQGINNANVHLTLNNIVNNHHNWYNSGVAFYVIFPPMFIDARNNWWGTPQGPNINMTWFYFDSYRTIRNVDASETVLFYGWRGLIAGLPHIFPWRNEPVPDTGP